MNTDLIWYMINCLDLEAMRTQIIKAQKQITETIEEIVKKYQIDDKEEIKKKINEIFTIIKKEIIKKIKQKEENNGN